MRFFIANLSRCHVVYVAVRVTVWWPTIVAVSDDFPVRDRIGACADRSVSSGTNYLQDNYYVTSTTRNSYHNNYE